MKHYAVSALRHIFPGNLEAKLLNFHFSYVQPMRLELDGPTLVVSPHADDEVIGTGTLLSTCKDVTVLLLTRDRSKHTRNIREKEFHACARYLRYEPIILEPTVYDGEGFKQLSSSHLIDHVNRSKNIFIPSPMESHPDHAAASRCVLSLPISMLKNKNIFLYEVWSSLPKISHFLPSNKRQLEALEIYKSQLNEFDYAQLIRTKSQYRGVMVSEVEAEGYLRIEASQIKRWQFGL